MNNCYSGYLQPAGQFNMAALWINNSTIWPGITLPSFPLTGIFVLKIEVKYSFMLHLKALLGSDVFAV